MSGNGEGDRSTRVSVIMNALNAERYLREAIASVFQQTYDDWEIVFWDNASQDATGDIARSFGARVRYFRAEETTPLGHARNLALAEATGRYVAFLDADDVWLPERLEKQVALMEANPGLGLVYANSIFFNQDSGKERLVFKKMPPTGRVFGELLGDYFLPIETVMLRRSALESLGEWFDVRFEVAEEADLFLRLAHDWEIGYVDAPLAKWRMHGESWTWTRGDLFPVELRWILEKLERLFPSFGVEYAVEISQVEAKIAYRLALREWRGGDTAGARRILRPHLSVRPALLAPYLFTFLSYRLFHELMRRRLRAA